MEVEHGPLEDYFPYKQGVFHVGVSESERSLIHTG